MKMRRVGWIVVTRGSSPTEADWTEVVGTQFFESEPRAKERAARYIKRTQHSEIARAVPVFIEEANG